MKNWGPYSISLAEISVSEKYTILNDKIIYKTIMCSVMFCNWGYSYFPMLWQFLLYSKVNHLYVCIYFLPLESTPPSHSSRQPQSTKLSSLCHPEGSRQLFVYHVVVYICQPQSPDSSHSFLQPHVYVSILCVCFCILALQRGSPVPFFYFHMS